MNAKTTLNALLEKRTIILDGAVGTELQKKGMPAGVCPERWCLNHPAVLTDIQTAYRKAGADILYACTFGANRLKLAEYGETDVFGINAALAKLARAAAGPKGLVAGDLGPTGRFVEPFGDLAFEDAVAIYREQVAGLIAGGVDLFVIETMIDIQETRAALLAVKESGDYTAIVTLTYEKDGRTLTGTDPVTALITLQSMGADVVGCNCSSGPEGMAAYLRAMKPFATVPLAAKPNAGMPRLKGKKTVFDMDSAAFGAWAKPLVEAGASLLGGCCGTTPDHIAAAAASLRKVKPYPPARTALAAVSSARGFREFRAGDPLAIIGERINPTGKKALQQELLEGKTALVRQMAREQEEQGADLLDVNVGVPGIDEAQAVRAVVSVLASATSLPLVLDSPKIETLEAALRLYPGRALINSVSGEREKIRRLLPLARKYGAMFVLLPLTDGEIPATCAGRQAVIRKVFRAAQRQGFTKEDIVVDGLVMTVASDPAAAKETLATVSWCTRVFGVRTVLGISNVSFGLPERKWMNAAFLTLAQGAGLTMAIANPGSAETMALKRGADVILQKDAGAAAYIAAFSGATQEKAAPAAAIRSPEERVRHAVLEGNRDDILAEIQVLLDRKMDPGAIVDGLMIPAILEVGDRYDKKTYFLPQLIASAEAMKKGLAFLEPLLAAGRGKRTQKGRVLLATVQGDIHDIGKNIVALMLRNAGYDVRDLGKDVATEAILAAMKKDRPDAVGLSALMTTTMTVMGEVMDRARKEGFKTPFVLGGAVLTPAYAASLGAAYARDGVEAVKVVDGLVRKTKKKI